MRHECDIFVSGGGIAGLTAAAAFGSAGFRVLCVDPAPPITDMDSPDADMRSTALLQPARQVLEKAGVWPSLAPHAAPLRVMRIVDAGRSGAEEPVVKSFESADLSDQPFGWNFPNWLLRRALVERLDALPLVDFRPGTSAATLFTRTATATVGLDDGSHAQAKLVIAADGRNSPMREAAGIPVTTRRYGQKALAFSVNHPIPHENVSTEIHLSGGPFTLVPLPDRNGLPCSAVVWMDDGRSSLARMALDTAAFEAEISARSCHLYGPLTLASPRAIWPIISQKAARFSAERLALIAEAAHVVPPIGAQGLNMSLADLATLLELTCDNRDDPGSAAVLASYHKARSADVTLRLHGIDALNRASQAQHPVAREARALGLNVLHGLPPLRQALMRMGLGMK